MSYMIGVDVGGTFTDFSVFNQETGELFNYKDSSTPADPSRAIVKGVKDVLEIKEAGAEEVSYLAHGTTVGTNALIEKKGCRHIGMDRIALQDPRAGKGTVDELRAVVAHDRNGICDTWKNTLPAAGESGKEMRLNETFRDQQGRIDGSFVQDAVRTGRQHADLDVL